MPLRKSEEVYREALNRMKARGIDHEMCVLYALGVREGYLAACRDKVKGDSNGSNGNSQNSKDGR